MKRNHRRAVAVAFGLTLAEAAMVARRRGSLLGAGIVVRCRCGHVFTTIWLPGVSLKAIRLGPWRLQRCPVGRHWTLVTPVKTSDLTPGERELAHRQHDLLVPTRGATEDTDSKE
ncbi:MAG TPA: hypothetical protein VG265_02650 [Gaiellaceae bacterium]|nr:hypothetical protein [Gaiellaceae bacterium]